MVDLPSTRPEMARSRLARPNGDRPGSHGEPTDLICGGYSVEMGLER